MAPHLQYQLNQNQRYCNSQNGSYLIFPLISNHVLLLMVSMSSMRKRAVQLYRINFSPTKRDSGQSVIRNYVTQYLSVLFISVPLNSSLFSLHSFYVIFVSSELFSILQNLVGEVKQHTQLICVDSILTFSCTFCGW